MNKNCRNGVPRRRQLPGIAIHMQHCPGVRPRAELVLGLHPVILHRLTLLPPSPGAAPFPDPRL